jgi:hypothetical protein
MSRPMKMIELWNALFWVRLSHRSQRAVS